MADAPEFDIAAAHEYFAAHCFNQAWDLIDKEERTPQDDLLMVALNQASIYHWLERGDCDDRRLSVGYWQASRIQAVLGNASEARRHAETCVSFTDELPPFYLGYAHEALARAATLAGDGGAGAAHLARARALAAQVEDEGERDALLGDLADL
jgi:hypothetical protein